MCNTYYIGWDVGAWECPSKPFAPKSQDCIVVLNEKKEMIWAWMGNVYAKMENGDNSFVDFFARLIESKQSIINKNEDCKDFSITEQDNVVIAIDAVLGLPLQACQLFDLNNETTPCFPQEREKCTNPLIFRKTEMSISENFKTTPLSLLKDRIGSQSTKALFSLKKWNMKWDITNFVWKKDKIIAFETYPAIAKAKDYDFYNSEYIKQCFNKGIEHDNTCWEDYRDAWICATIAYYFNNNQGGFFIGDDDKNSDEVKAEGWIWVPKSCLPDTTKDASCPTP